MRARTSRVACAIPWDTSRSRVGEQDDRPVRLVDVVQVLFA